MGAPFLSPEMTMKIQTAQTENCSKCRLNVADRVWREPEDFNYDAKFLFICEQFHPTLKNRLTRLLRSCDFQSDDFEVAFLARCYGGEELKAQIREGQHCLGPTEQLISKMSPSTVLVPMGATCCKVVAKKSSIQTAHGTVGEAFQRVCVPTLHPAQVIAYPDSLPTFLADLGKIADAGEGIFTEKVNTNYVLVDTVEKFKEMYAALASSEVFTFDIEADSLNPFRSKPHPKNVLMFSFSNRAEHAWALPLDHVESPWTPKQRAWVVKHLKLLLEKPEILKVPHHGKYDTKYIKATLGIEVANWNFDTMMGHYTGVTEEKGTHGLKILAWEYTDMGGYDDELDAYKKEHPEADPERGGKYGAIPLSLLWKYAAADADCTFRVYEKLKDKVYPEFEWLFDNIVMPATQTLAEIEAEGAPIDMKWHAYLAQEYPRLMKEQLDRLREFPEVLEVERRIHKKRVAKKQEERLGKLKARAKNIKILSKTDPDKAFKAGARLANDYEKFKANPPAVPPVVFNPASSVQKAMLLFKVMGFKPTKKAKGGGWSTDKEVLKDIWKASKHPVVQALGKYMKMTVLHSMFVESLPEIICDDGRLRGEYQVHGTETGRLSMSNPNLQQIPKNPKEDDFMDVKLPSIKKLFYAPPGYAILQFDYSQAELRVLAALSGEPVLRQAYMNGEDVHARVAADVAGISLEEVSDSQRGAAKAVNFGLLYGQGPARLARSLGWTEDEAKDFIRTYFSRLPMVRKYISRQKAKVRDAGFIQSPFGRVRRLASVFSPEQDIVAKAERQAVNARIQSTASDCTLLSLIRINAHLKAKGFKTRIIITVHDSIVFLTFIPELVKVYKAVKRIMEHPKNSDWLDGVPFVADAELGLSWGELQKVNSVEDIVTIVKDFPASQLVF